MSKVIIITCDQCKKEIAKDNLWTLRYQCDFIPTMNQSMHFCDYNYLFDYLNKAQKEANKECVL
jgi:hypothetical protein